jgi:hypothetical protein
MSNQSQAESEPGPDEVQRPELDEPEDPASVRHGSPPPILTESESDSESVPVQVKRPEVEEIGADRTTGGVLYYRVRYRNGKDNAFHWVQASNLTCADLIKQYEDSPKPKKVSEPKKPAERPPARELTEILGVVTDRRGSMYAVKFSDSPKAKVVTRAFLHSHYPDFLLDFYESRLSFIQLDPDAPRAEASPELNEEPDVTPTEPEIPAPEPE